MPCRLRVRQQQLDLAAVPAFNDVVVVHRLRVREAALQFCQLFLIGVGDDGVRPLVLCQQFFQPVKLVGAEPYRTSADAAVVDKPRRHLLQLGRHRRCVLRYDLVAAETRYILALHFIIRLAVVQRDAHLSDVTRRQLVLILARLQHERRRADALHDLLQCAGCRNPLPEVTVGTDEILLHERTLGTAQQPLVNDLALAEDIFKAVRRKRSCQSPAYLHRSHNFLQCFKAFAAGVFQPRQFVKHHSIKT